jgi:hypothetical protein
MIKEGNLIALLKLQQNHLVALQALEEVNLHRTSHMGQGRSQLPILFDDDGTSGDGLPSSRVDVGLHRVGKEKPRERPIMIQVPRKRKGPNAKV